MTIFLRYDNTSLQDGIGAQELRISGVYALSRAFGLGYIHSPVIRVIEDIGQDLGGGRSQSELMSTFNAFFNFPNSKKSPSDPMFINIKTLSLRKLIPLFTKYRFSSKDVVVTVLLPQGILDRLPILYEFAARKLRSINRDLLASHFSSDVVLHVRRGYDEKYADLKYARMRHLPFTYFSDMLKALNAKNLLTSESQILVHTDLVNRLTKWSPSQKGILDGYSLNSGKSGNSEIVLEAYDLSKEITFPEKSNYEILYCADLFEAFLDMSTTPILVQGKSAFSYLAGIVNPNFVIFPPLQKSAKLRRWKSYASFRVNLREELLG